jgi:hypothetical protein
MKRNLLKGIVLISVIALSSCSSTHKLTGTINADDDVYYTKATAGDQIEYTNNYQQNNNGDDDYYYYGDYASRINRFNYFTPFDYNDDFYYSYSPVNQFSLGLSLGFNSPYNYGYSPYGFGAIYSPFDYGYLPYYDLGGYDDIGYGGIYSAYLYGGGHRGRQRGRPNYLGGKSTGNAPLTFHPAHTGTGSLANRGLFYPGRPISSSSVNGANNTRMVRPERDTRQVTQQNLDRTPPPSNSNSSGSSNSGGGGGGRPVRP